MKGQIVIGSRESKLAVIQSKLVQDYIEKNNPDAEVSILKMKTTGDIILDRTLDKVGGKGLFVKELDKALMERRSDISVHSLKDVPMEVSEDLPLIAFSKREDPRDVLVLPKDAAQKGVTEPNPVLPIGCSGPRRQLQLKELFPECTIKPVRGNVLTRLEKLDKGEYGALVLAAAGLKRLGLEDRITRYFEPDEIIPAAGQGILAVQGRKGEDYGYLEGFEDLDSSLSARAERAFVRALNGGCSSPIAAYSVVKGDEMNLIGLYCDEKSQVWEKMSIKGVALKPEKLGYELAEKLKAAVEFKIREKAKMTVKSKNEAGKVWLVGAGPGDIGLFTLKGMEVLKSADVVVYDALVGSGVLSCIPEHAEIINVGKRASHHTMKQEDISRVLAEQAKKGRKVVRLKGGDPFMFGRGGEELELLTAEGIDYEVVPGVTAALSVPAYNGIPVTHRDFCSSLHIITGHKKQGADYDIDFEVLVRTKGTLVFLMGVAALEDICKGLLAGGMDPNMPAAVLQQGTTAGQKKIVATVSTLAEETAVQGVETPAIIVVGKVCSLADSFSWYEKLPLFGCRILVTRPKNRPSVMASKLRSMGAEVVEIPSVKTVAFSDQTRLKSELKKIDEYKWLVFTSPFGVEVFFDQLSSEKMDVRRLTGIKIAAIGAATANAVQKRGLMVDLVPKTYSAEQLGKELRQVCGDGDKVLIARAEIGSKDLTNELCPEEYKGNIKGNICEDIQREKGTNKTIHVTDVPIYETRYVSRDNVDMNKLLKENKINCVTFTSASTVKGLAASCSDVDFTQIKAACIGKQTEAAAAELGMKTYVAEAATMDSLTSLIVMLRSEDII